MCEIHGFGGNELINISHPLGADSSFAVLRDELLIKYRGKIFLLLVVLNV